MKEQRVKVDSDGEQAWIERVNKIKNHQETVLLKKEGLPEPWEYVEGRYPRIAKNIAQTVVYQNENRAFCRRIGIPEGVGGLFVVPASTVLLFYRRRVPAEVVIVHELLHFTSQLLGRNFTDEDFEEDFAYFESLPYLVSRGYTREWLADTYLYPFYAQKMAREYEERQGKALSASSRKSVFRDAKICCKRMVDKFLDGLDGNEKKGEDDLGRFYLY